ncbi:hypothetical protein KFK09_019505 [Dendrobium nobile]|uniref:DDE Tnp4 domain-containing protein n=1 Tax=Dendrobium nobile TaxID=94219 RepID=A0A8T3AWW7_DENNO|nr:hypothetical protein KFK09_019505 [Dendrobium nobile]
MLKLNLRDEEKAVFLVLLRGKANKQHSATSRRSYPAYPNRTKTSRKKFVDSTDSARSRPFLRLSRQRRLTLVEHVPREKNKLVDLLAKFGNPHTTALRKLLGVYVYPVLRVFELNMQLGLFGAMQNAFYNGYVFRLNHFRDSHQLLYRSSVISHSHALSSGDRSSQLSEIARHFDSNSRLRYHIAPRGNLPRLHRIVDRRLLARSGAIDGTHVDARVSTAEKVAYIGRCGSTTQNVMAVCDFNMCFTYVMSGWEGSVYDSRIFKFAIRNQQHKFPMPPPNKYYLVDAGYLMQRGFLKPFSDTKYHIPDFQRASQSIRWRKEAFNKRHSSLRGVIERSFGVWKKKWVILRDMPTYQFKKQVKIVVATMALHNYIRRHPSRDDPEFNVCDEDQSYIPPEAYEYRIGQSLIDNEGDMTNHEAEDGEGAEEMIQLREQITSTLVNEMN